MVFIKSASNFLIIKDGNYSQIILHDVPWCIGTNSSGFGISESIGVIRGILWEKEEPLLGILIIYRVF